MEQLRYKDDTDRSYGAAGMAIGLVIYDGDDLLAEINLDAPAGREMMTMTPDFYFAGSPVMSARAAWNQMVKNYNIAVGMLVGNVMCRHLVGRHAALPADVREALRSLAREEGAESCQLDEDEIDSIFEKAVRYMNRVFSHRGVQSVAHDFATTLAERRSMSRLDVLEQLQALRML